MPYWGYVLFINGLPVSDTIDYKEQNHSFVGELLANDLFGEGFKDLLVNQIISHHSGLHDCIDLDNVLHGKKVSEEIEPPHLYKRLLVKELNESHFCMKKVSMEYFHHFQGCSFLA